MSMWSSPREWSIHAVNDATMCCMEDNIVNRVEYVLAQGIRWDNRVMAQINRADNRATEARRVFIKKARAYGVAVNPEYVDFAVNMILYVRSKHIPHKEMFD